MLNRWDIINTFIEKYNYKTYLELGYYKGWSFDNVNCEYKVAVDPNPSKTPEQQSTPMGEEMILKQGFTGSKEYLCKTTSDDFFSSTWPEELGPKWDIIFIDGLHEADQVERDINNALNHLSPRGIIVLHDCNPPTLAHATTGDHAGNWNGDVYKAFIRFKMKFPEYPSYVIDTDWGCGVIENTLHKEFTCDMSNEDIERMLEWDYFDRNRKSLLDLITVEEFKTKMNEGTTDNNLSTIRSVF